MKNRITSARTAAQKSTTVETQDSSSHSNGNTFVGCSATLSDEKIPVINYFDEVNNQNCLEGLTKEEQNTFRSIFFKQFIKGIKIKITYSFFDKDSSSLVPM